MKPTVALVVRPSAEPSGHPVVPRFLDLLERGWDAHLVSADGDVAGLDAVSGDGRVHVARRSRWTRRRVHPLAVLRTLRPQLVHFPAAELARPWLPRNRGATRVVVGFDGENVGEAAIEEPERFRPLWQRADALHLDSEALVELARRSGAPEHAAAVVPPVPDAALLDASRPPAPDATLRILAVGPLSWTQGYEHALAAVKLLRDRGVPYEYRIVGRGEYADAVWFARYQLGLDDAVEIIEPAAGRALREHLSWADVLLNAAVAPASPKPVVDAQAAGIAVVTTEPPPTGAATALVVPRRDPEATADALGVLADDARRSELAAAGRRASRGLTLADQLARFRDLYDRVLGTPRRREER